MAVSHLQNGIQITTANSNQARPFNCLSPFLFSFRFLSLTLSPTFSAINNHSTNPLLPI